MKADDRTYKLFAEANPAPPTVVSSIERPSADALLNDSRRSTMLTKEPKLGEPTPIRVPRRRGPLIAFASFVAVVAVLGISLWLGSTGDDGSDAATQPPTETTTTTATPDTTVTPNTTLPPVVVGTVEVPDLVGLTLGDARTVLAELGLTIEAAPPVADEAVIVAQEPAVGIQIEEGGTILVDARVAATCEPPVESEPQAGQADINVVFACGGDGITPGEYHALQRLVPWGSGQPIERITWTLQSLLSGPNEEERSAGFTSFFDFATAEALNDVTLIDNHVVADFNEAIVVGNASTSTGSVLFNAELRANLFVHPEVDSVEFRLNGSCEAWSELFESDGCQVITRADWDQQVADWYAQRDA
jgi:hypothetical protein